jgi:hypothetical protein
MVFQIYFLNICNTNTKKACSAEGISKLFVKIKISPRGMPARNVIFANFQFQSCGLNDLAPFGK